MQTKFVIVAKNISKLKNKIKFKIIKLLISVSIQISFFELDRKAYIGRQTRNEEYIIKRRNKSQRKLNKK
jgi:hypothetical protein